jgi:hypothetical protein
MTKSTPPTKEENVIEIATADSKWETLLATEESQKLLEKMADEVWAQIQVSQAKPMIFAEDGKITPGQAQQI